MSYRNKILQTTKVVLENESIKIIGWFIDNKMQANPDKFQAIVLGKLGFENCKSLNICGSTIQCEETVKLLGVTFDYMLNFEAHIANICKKAARQINVLLRLSNVLNQETKILIYKSFIYSNFNYCHLVWHFCSKASTDKLEKLQFRAVRLVFNDFTSSYDDDLLTKANMPTLHISRIRTMALEAFKILYKMSPKYLHDLISFKNTNYSFRYENLVDVPSVRTSRYGKATFRFEAAQLWNSLPNYIRATGEFGEFVRLIRTWGGTQCKCSLCRFSL